MTILSIALGALNREGFGQVVVPDVFEQLFCPQCGTEASDNGECLVKFVEIPNENPNPELAARAPLILALFADCRTCGYYGPGPTSHFIAPE